MMLMPEVSVLVTTFVAFRNEKEEERKRRVIERRFP